MAIFEQSFYGNTLAGWLFAVAIAAVIVSLLLVARAVLARRLAARRDVVERRAQEVVLELGKRTHVAFLVILGTYAGIYFLTLPAPARQFADSAVVIALLAQAAIWGSHLVGEWLARQTRRRAEEDTAAATTLDVLGAPAKIAVWALALLLALDNLGIDVSALIAGLGIGGLAVALATQNILGDLFASLSIALDRPFAINDFIIVGDQLGTVERIGLKTTRVRSLSGELIVFSNADLLQSRIRNYKQMYERRVVSGFGVVYQTEPGTVEAIPAMVREIIEAQPTVRFDRAHFKGFGNFSLDFEFVFYVMVPDYNVYMDRQQAINLGIMRRFQDHGIGFAYPTQTIYIERVAEAPGGLPAAAS